MSEVDLQNWGIWFAWGQVSQGNQRTEAYNLHPINIEFRQNNLTYETLPISRIRGRLF